MGSPSHASYKSHYARFLADKIGIQHFACHSHHYWPDVTREAMLSYWDDSARLVDDKWQHLVGVKVPRAQQLIAEILALPHPEQIVFAPSTHELLSRLISCLDVTRPARILSTDSEFHSFSRQIARLAELPQVSVVRVPAEPFASFADRLVAALAHDRFDMVFFSQVFYNSGFLIPDLDRIVAAVTDPETIIAIDGYQGFCAVPTDLGAIAARVFYLAGSYKYAQGGEGCCFMAVPRGTTLRPLYTGWFAEFGTVSQASSGSVAYADDGWRFAGSTMDHAALYRLVAVLEWWQRDRITVPAVHRHVQGLQAAFLAELERRHHAELARKSLLVHDLDRHGHFLCFRLSSPERAAALAAYLREHRIITDHRGDRLRFGFGLYHDPEDYDLSCLAS